MADKKSNKKQNKTQVNKTAHNKPIIEDWRVIKEEKVGGPAGVLVTILALIVFLIPMIVSGFMGLEGIEAFKVEALGWLIEAAIGGVIYLVSKILHK